MRFRKITIICLFFIISVATVSVSGISSNHITTQASNFALDSLRLNSHQNTKANFSIAEDWIISNETTVENSVIILNGNLIIKNGGALVLKNVTIFVNNKIHLQYGIEVQNGGNITIRDSKITSYDENYGFYFRIYGKILIERSEISYAGSDQLNEGGIDISTDYPVIIRDSYIHNNFFGIRVLNSLKVEIINNTIDDTMYGIMLGGISNVQINNNTISNSYFTGIYDDGIYNGTILNNVITKTQTGISFAYSNNLLIANNTFLYCKNEGIRFGYACTNVTIINNTFMEIDSHAILVEYNSGNFILGNTFRNIKQTAISAMKIKNTTIQANLFYDNLGLFLVQSIGVTIKDNNFTHSGLLVDGVVVSHFNHTVINNLVNDLPLCYVFNKNNVTIDSQNIGQLFVVFSNRVSIHSIQITNSTNGIYVGYSSNITVSESNVTSNKVAGIYIQHSKNITIHSGFMKYNQYGLYVDTSENVSIHNNTLYKNQIGVTLHLSKNITVFLNNFIFNDRQAVDDRSNVFDNGTRGNFWSDFGEKDFDNDGIVDTPYHVDIDSIDHYPLAQSTVALETKSPIIEYVLQIPESVKEGETVLIQANVTDDSKVALVILSYSNGTMWINITMEYNEKNGYYEASIPSQLVGVTVRYRVFAKDIYGNWATTQMYSYIVSSSNNQQYSLLWDASTFIIVMSVLGVAATSVVFLVAKLRKK